MKARALLLTAHEVEAALGPKVHVTGSEDRGPESAMGAVDSAYRRFTGDVTSNGATRRLAVSVMALLFDSPEKVRHTYQQVADAAHLRTQIQGADVAVETVTAPSGLVSYWGYVFRDSVIVIVTLDTLDPQQVSIADLRALMTVAARKLASLSP